MASGAGHSLVPKNINPTTNPNNTEYWRSSLEIFGSPFADDTNEIFELISNLKNSNSEISIYPNPTSSIIYIYNKNNDPLFEILLTNMNGQLIYMQQINNNNNLFMLNLFELGIKQGVYLLKLTTNNEIITKKIIYQE